MSDMKIDVKKLGTETDGAPPVEVLAAVETCALSWEPLVRLVGNVRAEDIARACRHAIDLMQKQVEVNTWGLQMMEGLGKFLQKVIDGGPQTSQIMVGFDGPGGEDIPVVHLWATPSRVVGCSPRSGTRSARGRTRKSCAGSSGTSRRNRVPGAKSRSRTPARSAWTASRRRPDELLPLRVG